MLNMLFIFGIPVFWVKIVLVILEKVIEIIT